MKTINNVQELKSETSTYRAPRLVALGNAVDILQFGYGNVFDSSTGNGRENKR